MENLDKQSGTISAMFDQIAPSYDFLNHLLSLNIDKYWRRKMTCFLLRRHVGSVLDVACGTGDSTIALYKRGMTATGVDIAGKMLEEALAKNKKLIRTGKQPSDAAGKPVPLPEYLSASAEDLPFPDRRFDAVSISFGIRNFDRRAHCLQEIYRVIRPGGYLAVLEFAKPRNKVLRGIYNLYFNHLLPFIGKAVSKERHAYAYLAKSVEQFPKYESFARELEDAGFKEVSYEKYTFGIAVLYTGKRY